MRKAVMIGLMMLLIILSYSQEKGLFYQKGTKVLTLTPVVSGSSNARTIGINAGIGYMVMKKAEVGVSVLGALGAQKIIGLRASARYYLFNSSLICIRLWIWVFILVWLPLNTLVIMPV